ncbi:transposase [Streptacidiphilus sp. P02-A3a]|uniref:transposase n=1 Tax=Streptacidiphilus sp. P02-A3a TaxID=2704468 RepID=UPI001CDD051B|nr:transposase [Streptacidiphilus sp. P02-A3a]
MSDAGWAVVRDAMPVPGWLEGRGGQPEAYCHRQMIDAVRYLNDNGCKWLAMPLDFPLWDRVYAFNRRWRIKGLLGELHDRLRVQDRDAARPLLRHARARFHRLALVWADGAYTGRLVDWAAEKLHLELQIIKRSDDTSGFVVLPRRWVVERTNAWLMRTRRLARDYEGLPEVHEQMVVWSMTTLMTRRLARRRA